MNHNSHSKPNLHYDLVVVGGGIHGVGIAADAQGRGLNVLLCEKSDLASATSSASSKMIHGGLRYLAQYQFALVKDALQERQKLCQLAPHLVRPQSFLIPHRPNLQSFWRTRIGLYLYDLLGARKPFKRSDVIVLNQHALKTFLKADIQNAFTYSDAVTDDARLVISNAKRFSALGGTLKTRTECIQTKAISKGWEIKLQNHHLKQTEIVTATALVNAAGPWVTSLIERTQMKSFTCTTRLVKGSHLIIKNPYPHDQGFLLPHTDGRVIFVIPYQEKFALIGTTDIPYDGDPADVHISEPEIDYLFDIVKSYLHPKIAKEDIVHSWSGVRTLLAEEQKDPHENSREYRLDLHKKGNAVLLNVIGGKLTTYRLVAEKAVNMLAPYFSHCGKAWTDTTPLPGGILQTNCAKKELIRYQNHYSWLPAKTITRYFYQLGSDIHHLLGGCSKLTDLGQCFGADLYERECLYYTNNEWAITAEDIIWRRTKLGLSLSPSEIHSLENWIARQSL